MAEAILKRIAAGDKTAVQECLNTYGGLVWSLARRMCPNRDDAEDAVQEIFVDVWKYSHRFDDAQASETTFVAMIARRRLIDRIRKSNRQVPTDSVEDMLHEPPTREDKKIQTNVEAKQAAKVLSELNPDRRKILRLSIFHGLTHQEISEATGIPLGTVKTHARRGLIQIRESLGINPTNSSKEVAL
jgi:RNA polymerase sigma-70 factor (ECF subfamily)